MKKIMFVCHGNICRSPMAEFIMKHLVYERGLRDKYLVASSATSTEEIGNPIYPPARRELERRGISGFADKRAVQITRADAEESDILVCMDSANVRNMRRIIGDGYSDKTHKMMSFVGSDGDVADPWYYGGFDAVFDDISRAVHSMLDLMESGEL